MVTPEQVFTPRAPVGEDMYAARRYEALEDRVRNALAEQGAQVVLYGETGVGKTSLVNHLARGVKMVRIECGPSFDLMLNAAIAQVRPERDVDSTHTESRNAEGGASLGPLKAGIEAGHSHARRREPVPVGIAPEAVQALEGSGVRLLFFDNFENLQGTTHERDTTRALAHLLKSLADRADENPHALKAVVAGIPSASEELISLDQATARRTAQIEVPRMPRDELDQILGRGERKLRISFAGHARHLILSYSDGFPYYTHLLALHCARRVLSDGRNEVTLPDFDDALDEILAGCDLTLRSQYNRAAETSGQVRARKSIMEAVASMNDNEVTFKQIRTAFLAAHSGYGNDPNRLNFLSTAIKPLKDEYGILVDRGHPKSRRNAYRFRNPLMRAYVRLRMRKESLGRAGIWDPMQGFATFSTAPETTTS